MSSPRDAAEVNDLTASAKINKSSALRSRNLQSSGDLLQQTPPVANDCVSPP